MKSKTFNLSLPAPLVSKIDKAAKREFRSRSELIREAVRAYLAEAEEWEVLFKYGEKKAKELRITSEEQIDQIVHDFRHGKT